MEGAKVSWECLRAQSLGEDLCKGKTEPEKKFINSSAGRRDSGNGSNWNLQLICIRQHNKALTMVACYIRPSLLNEWEKHFSTCWNFQSTQLIAW